MDRLSKEQILEALAALAQELERRGSSAHLLVVGGAAVVLLYGARESTKDVDERNEVWQEIERFLVPGRELKAQYAFADLWEAERGHP